MGIQFSRQKPSPAWESSTGTGERLSRHGMRISGGECSRAYALSMNKGRAGASSTNSGHSSLNRPSVSLMIFTMDWQEWRLIFSIVCQVTWSAESGVISTSWANGFGNRRAEPMWVRWASCPRPGADHCWHEPMAKQGNLPSREDPGSLPKSGCLASNWTCPTWRVFSASGPAQFVLMNGQGEMPVASCLGRRNAYFVRGSFTGLVLRAKDRLLRARCEMPLASCSERRDRLLRARLIWSCAAHFGRARCEMPVASCLGRRNAYFVRGVKCRWPRAQGEGSLTSCAAHCGRGSWDNPELRDEYLNGLA